MADVGGLNCGRTVVTTGGTPVQLDSSTARISRVVIQGNTANTNPVVIGDSSVVAAVGTRKGISLGPGVMVEVDISQLSGIYVDAVTNGESVNWMSSIAGT